MTGIAGATKAVIAPPDPYELGGLAWFRDQTELDCPYPIPGTRAERWLAGWRESQAVFDRTPGTVADFEMGEAGA